MQEAPPHHTMPPSRQKKLLADVFGKDADSEEELTLSSEEEEDSDSEARLSDDSDDVVETPAPAKNRQSSSRSPKTCPRTKKTPQRTHTRVQQSQSEEDESISSSSSTSSHSLKKSASSKNVASGGTAHSKKTSAARSTSSKTTHKVNKESSKHVNKNRKPLLIPYVSLYRTGVPKKPTTKKSNKPVYDEEDEDDEEKITSQPPSPPPRKPVVSDDEDDEDDETSHSTPPTKSPEQTEDESALAAKQLLALSVGIELSESEDESDETQIETPTSSEVTDQLRLMSEMIVQMPPVLSPIKDYPSPPNASELLRLDEQAHSAQSEIELLQAAIDASKHASAAGGIPGLGDVLEAVAAVEAGEASNHAVENTTEDVKTVENTTEDVKTVEELVTVETVEETATAEETEETATAEETVTVEAIEAVKKQKCRLLQEPEWPPSPFREPALPPKKTLARVPCTPPQPSTAPTAPGPLGFLKGLINAAIQGESSPSPSDVLELCADDSREFESKPTTQEKPEKPIKKPAKKPAKVNKCTLLTETVCETAKPTAVVEASLEKKRRQEQREQKNKEREERARQQKEREEREEREKARQQKEREERARQQKEREEREEKARLQKESEEREREREERRRQKQIKRKAEKDSVEEDGEVKDEEPAQTHLMKVDVQPKKPKQSEEPCGNQNHPAQFLQALFEAKAALMVAAANMPPMMCLPYKWGKSALSECRSHVLEVFVQAVQACGVESLWSNRAAVQASTMEGVEGTEVPTAVVVVHLMLQHVLNSHECSLVGRFLPLAHSYIANTPSAAVVEYLMARERLTRDRGKAAKKEKLRFPQFEGAESLLAQRSSGLLYELLNANVNHRKDPMSTTPWLQRCLSAMCSELYGHYATPLMCADLLMALQCAPELPKVDGTIFTTNGSSTVTVSELVSVMMATRPKEYALVGKIMALNLTKNWLKFASMTSKTLLHYACAASVWVSAAPPASVFEEDEDLAWLFAIRQAKVPICPHVPSMTALMCALRWMNTHKSRRAVGCIVDHYKQQVHMMSENSEHKIKAWSAKNYHDILHQMRPASMFCGDRPCAKSSSRAETGTLPSRDAVRELQQKTAASIPRKSALKVTAQSCAEESSEEETTTTSTKRVRLAEPPKRHNGRSRSRSRAALESDDDDDDDACSAYSGYSAHSAHSRSRSSRRRGGNDGSHQLLTQFLASLSAAAPNWMQQTAPAVYPGGQYPAQQQYGYPTGAAQPQQYYGQQQWGSSAASSSSGYYGSSGATSGASSSGSSPTASAQQYDTSRRH
ncbi:protein ORF155 [Cyprinid herpesvirus 1]|uniref:Protein ORF155 n=1 Tax=Cyprinid herpesvirus 1 TaxID=317858 RepID=K7PCM1_9VIRU|nr:protein ORF155 [Cyprinid herpesvirus 1]AFJ20445.1 protein ORF155 [Cyprinid herpesvirus 1]